MKRNIVKSFLKKLTIFSIGLYVIYTFLSQQKTLNAYKEDQERYKEQILAQEERKENLNQIKANINSEEYIEEIARKSLDMYLPNEKVYIDISK